MKELKQSPKKQGSLPSYLLGVGFLLLLIGYISSGASNQSSISVSAAWDYFLWGALAFLVGMVLFLVGLVKALHSIKRAIALHHACVLLGAGLLLLFLGVLFVQDDSANTYWLNFFYWGICAIPIGIVLTLVGIVRALRDANLEIPPGITTNADVLEGTSQGRSSLADYHQMPGYAPSTLSSSLPAPEETPLTQPPVLDQEFSRRALLIMVSGLAAEAAIGFSAFKLIRKPITPDFFTYQGHTDIVTSVAWSPDGTYIVSTSYDETVQVWHPLTGKLFVTVKDPAGVSGNAAWSPDSRCIASCHGLTLQIWDVITRKVLWTYRSQDQNVEILGVAWSPDGTRIASASDSVYVFDAAPGHRIAHALPLQVAMVR